MKRASLLVILIIMTAIISGCSSQEHDFRNVDWNMSSKEVMDNEDVKLTKENGAGIGEFSLEGKTEIENGIKTNLIYRFDSDKLTAAVYEILEEDNREKSLEEITLFLRNKLTQEYGDPAINSQIPIVKWNKDQVTDIGFGPSINQSGEIYGLNLIYMMKR